MVGGSKDRRGAALTTTAVWVLSVTLAGCGSGAASLPQVSPSGDADQLRKVAARYLVTKDDQRLFIEASHEASRRCLERFGVEAAQSPPIDEASLENSVAERPIGIADRDAVAEWGYHPVPADEAAEEVPKDAWNPSARELELRRGTNDEGQGVSATDASGDPLPEGGCDGESIRMVLSGPDWDMFRGQHLFREAIERAEADPRLAASWKEWSACMAEGGFRYETPWDANDDVRWWASSEPTALEVTVATRDLDCRESSGTQALWIGLINAYEQQLIEQEGASLAEWAERLERNRKAAKELVRDST